MEQQNNQTQEHELINLQWAALEFEKHKKTPAWFLTIGIIALIIFAVALLMKSFIFAILILLSVFTIFIYAVKEPKMVDFKIDQNGISINEKNYPYEDLNSFWIFYTPPSLKELSVKSKKLMTPMIKIPLANQDPLAIRRALTKFIPEEKQEESLVDIIARSIGF